VCLAAAEPKSRRMRWRDRSIPVVTPADVRMSRRRRRGVGQHVDLGVAALELGGPPPVSGGRFVEDTRRGEGKSLRCRSIPIGRPGVCRAYGVEHRRRDCGVDVFRIPG